MFRRYLLISLSLALIFALPSCGPSPDSNLQAILARGAKVRASVSVSNNAIFQGETLSILAHVEFLGPEPPILARPVVKVTDPDRCIVKHWFIDASGQLVTGFPAPYEISTGDRFTFDISWDLTDSKGEVLPEGRYTIKANTEVTQGNVSSGLPTVGEVGEEGALDILMLQRVPGTMIIKLYDASRSRSQASIPDEHLNGIIAGVLNKEGGTNIYTVELASDDLADFHAVGEEIKDITGIEHMLNLATLNLAQNQISDISPLVSLTNLAELYIWGNQISDISPLTSLTNLTDLALNGNPIKDISPLGSLTNLIHLWLHTSQITDISPLGNLEELTALYLDDNEISDVSPLANLTMLRTLDLGHNQIRDISPLTNLTNLTNLDLTGNPLNTESVNVIIPQLEERGVEVRR